MTKFLLIGLLQFLSGITIPLYTVRYGKMKVPIVLQYQPEADSSGYRVVPGWTLRIGENPFSTPESDIVCGEGTHFRYGPRGELMQMEDDAGNRIEFLPTGVFWSRGMVELSFSGGFVNGFSVFDADSICIRKVSFDAESELYAVYIHGRDSVEVDGFRMDYTDASILRSITRTGGGSVEFSFFPDTCRMLKRSVCRKDAEGNVTGTSEYAYSSDSLGYFITETVTDGWAITRKTVHGFRDDRIIKREEYAGDGHLTRSTNYEYAEGDEGVFLETVTITNYPEDSLAPSCSRVHSYKYAEGQPYPYPIEVETIDSCGASERRAYTYPFCPPANYGSVADSLLARGKVDAVLSLTRWKEGGLVDSTTIVYDGFPAAEAHFGKVYRPAAIVYSDGETKPETCIKYTAYDTLGLRMSRAKVLHKRSADRLPKEIFRWTAPVPMADLVREQLSYDVCAAWPEVIPDNESGGSFLFDGSGAYLGKVADSEPEGRAIVDRGFGEEPLLARFSDPDNTPLQINGLTALEVVSDDAMIADLDKAGAFEESHHGFVKGIWYLWCESQFGRQLDFASNTTYEIYPGILYVTEAGRKGFLVHDNYNFGNFLWGAAAHEAGVPQWIALFGSHVHTFFSPFSWGSFDSLDDVLSIRSGYHWNGR